MVNKDLVTVQRLTVNDPYGALVNEIEAAATRGDLSPDIRLSKLDGWRTNVIDLLGRIDTYMADLQLVVVAQKKREAAPETAQEGRRDDG
jgi:hypothetical protein